MGCVQSYLSKRSRAYRVNHSSELLKEVALESRRGKEQHNSAQATVRGGGKPNEDKTQQQATGKKDQDAQQQQQQQPSNAAAAPAKQKLDPKDFMFYGLKGETRVKLPGSINGQQFIIDNCQDCDLFVMDACASVTVDDCTNCRIFIGPTEGSVFIRDCSGCTFAVLTRQLRTRDCHDCTLALLCRSRPIVEASSRLRLACYSQAYHGLAGQLQQQRMSPFHNFWSHVYDFTPAAAAEAPHWRLVRGAEGSFAALFPRLPAQVQELVAQGEAACVLGTWGEGELPAELAAGQPPLLLLFPHGAARQAVELAARCCSSGGASSGPAASASNSGDAGSAGNAELEPAAGSAITAAAAAAADADASATSLAEPSSVPGELLLVCTNEVQLSASLAEQMAQAAGWDPAALKAAAATKTSMIALEVVGTAAALERLQQEAVAAGARCTRSQAAAVMVRHLGIEG